MRREVGWAGVSEEDKMSSPAREDLQTFGLFLDDGGAAAAGRHRDDDDQEYQREYADGDPDRGVPPCAAAAAVADVDVHIELALRGLTLCPREHWPRGRHVAHHRD